MKQLFLLMSCAVFVTACATNQQPTSPAPVINEAVTTTPRPVNLPDLPAETEATPSPRYPSYSKIVRSRSTVLPACKPAAKAKSKPKPAAKKVVSKKPQKNTVKALPKLRSKPVVKAKAKSSSKPAHKTKHSAKPAVDKRKAIAKQFVR